MNCPVMINLQNKKIVVIGGGKIAYSKVKTLIKYNPKIKVISKELDKRFEELMFYIEWIDENWKDENFERAYLTIAATNDDKINESIGRLCEENHQLFNRVDKGLDSDFMMMGTVERGDLSIGVSTNGKCPALTKHIKDDLEKHFAKEYGEYLEELGIWRQLMIDNHLSASEKRLKFQELIPLDLNTLKKRRIIYEDNCGIKR